ncbi:MAG: sensor histidine kinase [Actinophytocola sp.]|uniref:sensor histidine kinase n=1 Tax=Actinophytocola sp. TaxID=1872138 RepID=UPI003D6A3E52
MGAPFGRRQRGEFGLALIGLIPGLVGGVLTLVLLSAGAVLTVVNIGLLLLVGVLAGVRHLGGFHRWLLRRLVGEHIPPPRRDARPSGLAAARRRLTGSDGWRAVAYVLLYIPLSVLLFVVLVGVRVYGFGFLTYPLWWWLLDSDGERGLGVGELQLDTWPSMVVVCVVGLAVLALSTWGGGRLVALVVAAARALLGPAPLSARVRALEETRGLAVADSAAALRRIERDLHDGAQARLVALAMSLTMAKEKLQPAAPSGEQLDQAKALVDGALRGARTAIQELRELVRGIHPPMLDVGLAEALESLVADYRPSVTVDSRLRRRPSPAVETIAYFCAAELITNAAWHSAAGEITVLLRQSDDELVVTVRDDGRGGAVIGAGSGLTGLATRIRPVDGTLDLSSPPGGPTTAVVRLPLSVPS